MLMPPNRVDGPRSAMRCHVRVSERRRGVGTFVGVRARVLPTLSEVGRTLSFPTFCRGSQGRLQNEASARREAHRITWEGRAARV